MKFKFKPNYVIIPLITVLVSIVGSAFSNAGMIWYNTEIIRPELTPPNWIFPVAWTIIYIFTTISALIVWNTRTLTKKFLLVFTKKGEDNTFVLIMVLFIINAFLNVFWSLLFFTFRFMYAAFVEMMLLELTVVLLMILIYKRSKIASLLLLPYAVWVAFATYLTSQIIQLN